MEKMVQLRQLLEHEVKDLYSAEEQIIAALPDMIDKATDRKLSKSLTDHLKVTEAQKNRLDKVLSLIKSIPDENQGSDDKKGFFAQLFKGSQKCKGMAGLIDEGEKVMAEKMSPDVMDAAIIGSAQKIEHYEICGYGTARAYAEELGLTEIEKLLKQTLNEEYEADDLLTQLAVSRLNKEANGSTRRRAGITKKRTKPLRSGTKQRANTRRKASAK